MIHLLLEELLLESERLQRERALAHEMRLRAAKAESGRTMTARRWFAERLVALGMRVAPAGTRWECVPAMSPDRRLRAT